MKQFSVLQNGKGENAFGSNDLVYEGDINKWLRFASSLRLRLAMRISYIKPTLAKSEAEKAVNNGLMKDNSDNAAVYTNQNSQNPYNTISAWGEYRMSAAMESMLEGYKDPRLRIYFSKAENGDRDGDGSAYEGIRNGVPRENKNADLVADYSNMGDKWLTTNRPGPPMPVMNISEVYFLRAEGALHGWNMGGGLRNFMKREFGCL